MQYAEPISELIKGLSSLPGIGEKTAARLALYILNSDREYVEGLARALLDVKDRVRLCSECMAFSESTHCKICADPSRDEGLLCVVSDYKDMVALEATGGYRGRYHILHGLLAPLKGMGPQDIRIRELMDRVKRGGVCEVILATPFDSEGEATALYIAKLLKPLGLKLTRIASGVPVGSYLEYMDSATLGRAMEGRREIRT